MGRNGNGGSREDSGVWFVLQQSSQDCKVENFPGLVDRRVWDSKVRSHLREVWAADGTMLGSGARMKALPVDEIAGGEGRFLPRPLVSFLPNEVAPGHQLCARPCVHSFEVLRDLRLSLPSKTC